MQKIATSERAREGDTLMVKGRTPEPFRQSMERQGRSLGAKEEELMPGLRIVFIPVPPECVEALGKTLVALLRLQGVRHMGLIGREDKWVFPARQRPWNARHPRFPAPIGDFEKIALFPRKNEYSGIDDLEIRHPGATVDKIFIVITIDNFGRPACLSRL